MRKMNKLVCFFIKVCGIYSICFGIIEFFSIIPITICYYLGLCSGYCILFSIPYPVAIGYGLILFDIIKKMNTYNEKT